ncbi:hypothetical protein V2J09_016891 [Rumex salicifolius]
MAIKSSYLLSTMLFLALAVLASADYYGYSSPSPVYKSPVYTPSPEYKSSPIYTPSPYYKKPTPAVYHRPTSYLLSSMLFLALAVLASADYYGYSSPSPVYKSPVYTPSLEYKSSPIYTPSPYYKKPTPAALSFEEEEENINVKEYPTVKSILRIHGSSPPPRRGSMELTRPLPEPPQINIKANEEGILQLILHSCLSILIA